jgi:hypothetical protein
MKTWIRKPTTAPTPAFDRLAAFIAAAGPEPISVPIELLDDMISEAVANGTAPLKLPLPAQTFTTESRRKKHPGGKT